MSQKIFSRFPMRTDYGVRFSAWIGLVGILLCLATCAVAESCPSGISQATAQRAMDVLKRTQLGKDYSFDGLRTDKARMEVLWSRSGKPCPPIYVDFEECAAADSVPKLQIHAAGEVAAECPGLEAIIPRLSDALRGEHPADWNPPVSALPLVIIACAVGIGLVIRHLLTPADGDICWGLLGAIVFTAAATTPFFIDDPAIVTWELAAAWVIFAILLFYRERLPTENRRGVVVLFALFLFSFLIRRWLCSNGPGDLNLNLVAIWSDYLEGRWGHAPIAFFRAVRWVLGDIQDTHIIWCNLVLSSLVPVVIYKILRELGLDEVAALATAFLVSAHPVLIVFSGVLERQPLYTLSAFGSTLALIGFLKRGRWNQFAAFVLGTVLATTSRPEGSQILILHGAVLLFVMAGRRARTIATVTMAFLSVVAGLYALSHAALGPGGGGLHSYTDPMPFTWTVLLDPDLTPLVWIVAWISGIFMCLGQRAAWVALTTVIGVDLVWKWTGLYKMILGFERQVASARYETILLVPFVIGLALFVQTLSRVRNTMWKIGLLVIFLLGTAISYKRPFEVVLRPFTIDYEYYFLKKHALTLPPSSNVYIFDPPITDDGFNDARLVGKFVANRARFGNWRERICDHLARDLSSTYLYIGSACAELANPAGGVRDQWFSDCKLVRERVIRNSVEEVEVPAHKMAWDDFKARTVRLGLYRLTDASICTIGPRSPHRSDPQ